MSAAVLVQNAKKTFGNFNLPVWKNVSRTGSRLGSIPGPVIALDSVSFQVSRGEIFGLLGPGGSGKSTLIRMMGTLLRPDSGRIQVFGYDVVHQASLVQRMINPIWVEASFFKKISVLENLSHGLRNTNMNGNETRRLILDTLARLGLNERDASQPMEQLSRPTQQKVSIARALLSQPQLLLLDEPTIGLDPGTKQEIYQALRDLSAEQAMTVILATRDRFEAVSLCDRIAVLANGRIEKIESPPPRSWTTFQKEAVSLYDLFWMQNSEEPLVGENQ